MSDRPVIFWFRRDLRLADNEALSLTARSGPVIPVFIDAPHEQAWSPGAASRWWLHHSLEHLGRSLEKSGSRLILRRGGSVDNLVDLAVETSAKGVFWNRLYEPVIRERDDRAEQALRQRGIEVTTGNGSLLVEPWNLATRSGSPFRVFTPFWRALQAQLEPSPTLRKPALRAPAPWPDSLMLRDLDLLPRPNWAQGLADTWSPGEEGAAHRLSAFDSAQVSCYDDRRDVPGAEATSRLSPHLAFGELSPRQVLSAASRCGDEAAAEPWLRQIGWREFAHHLLYHFPHTVDEPMRPEFSRFPWQCSRSDLRAWQQSKTGYPLVDAGMRQLWQAGWMHNRVRMVVASFLVKHLLLPWQQGARWFWDTLVDADLANNTLGWQWTAGCGADAAPYFRIFNPTRQAERFDPEGEYVRTWVPELRGVSDERIHNPHEIDGGASTGHLPGYSAPLVEHSSARRRALAAWEAMKA